MAVETGPVRAQTENPSAFASLLLGPRTLGTQSTRTGQVAGGPVAVSGDPGHAQAEKAEVPAGAIFLGRPLPPLPARACVAPRPLPKNLKQSFLRIHPRTGTG